VTVNKDDKIDGIIERRKIETEWDRTSRKSSQTCIDIPPPTELACLGWLFGINSRS
jgi:hypothetical protein